MKYDAFISYRRNNGYLMAKYVRDHLAEAGINCFLDLEELKAEDFFTRILEEVIPNTPNLILILAPNVLNRCVKEDDWMRMEITTAQDHGCKIIPIMYNEFIWPKKWNKNMPENIRNLKRLNAIKANQYYLPGMIDKVREFMKDDGQDTHEEKPTLNIASTNLTVIDAFMQGCDYKKLLREYGFSVRTKTYNWGDKILEDLSNGKLDLAFYNKESCLHYNETHDKKISIVRDICSSVGGRNFYILASKKGKWEKMTLDNFKEVLDKDTVIEVSRDSDRFKNLLYILDMTEDELNRRGVQIHDFTPNQGLGIMDVNPDVLLIAGQDIRYLAEWKNDYQEIISYDDFPQDKRDFFYKNSVNSLLIGPAGMEKLSGLDTDLIGIELARNFYNNAADKKCWEKIHEKISDKLNTICCEKDGMDYIANKIIFETYRLLPVQSAEE